MLKESPCWDCSETGDIEYAGIDPLVPLTVTPPVVQVGSSSPPPVVRVWFFDSPAQVSLAEWSMLAAKHTHHNMRITIYSICRHYIGHYLFLISVWAYKKPHVVIHLSSQACPCGGKVDLCDHRCCVRWNERTGVAGRQKEPEILIIVNDFVSDLHYISWP